MTDLVAPEWWGVAEAAAHCGVRPGTWRDYVARGRAPQPDDPDEGAPPQRRRPRWRAETVRSWQASRPRAPRHEEVIRMSPPVNVIRTGTGTLRPVCEFCGRVGRAATPTRTDGQLSVLDVTDGWAVVPYPPDFTHADGSTGDLWRCPTCGDRLDRGEVLTPDAGRGAR